MLFAAEHDNWDFFLDLGNRYNVLVDALEAHGLPKDPAIQKQCADLLESVLQIDLDIRALADKQLGHIRRQIAQTLRERRIHQTYVQHPYPA